jgi:hypothetical protein
MMGFIYASFTINDCLRLNPFLIGLQVPSLLLWWMTNEESLLTLLNAKSRLSWTELTSRWTKYESLCLTVPLLLCFSVFNHRCRNVLNELLPRKWIFPCSSVAWGTCLPNRCLGMNFLSGSTLLAFRRHVTVFSKKKYLLFQSIF